MPSAPRHSLLDPAGHVISTDLATGRETYRDTFQCCHCGGHVVVQPGSGTRRGFCLKHMAPTCGAPQCDPCRDWQDQLEAAEAAAVPDQRGLVLPFVLRDQPPPEALL